jgi:3-oxoacyl-[acyl-carrier-protein] synthase-3
MKPTIQLKSMAYALPSISLPNGSPQYSRLGEVPEGWFDFWGIRSRQVMDPAKGESELELACDVANRALRYAGIEAGQLDMVLASMTSPYISTDGTPEGRLIAPRLSGMLKQRIGAARALNTDIEAECAGFVFNLQIAANLIRQGRIKHALICASERFSSVLDYSCKSSITFGDGAIAGVLSAGEADSPYDLLDAVYRSDARHYGLATAKWRYPRWIEEAGQDAAQAHPETFNAYFTLKTHTKDEIARFMPEAIPDIVGRLFKKTGVRVEDVDAMVFHQPSQMLVDGWAATLGLPKDRYVVKLADCACLASASVPLALYESIRKGVVKPGSQVVLAGAGAGWSFGAQLWRMGPVAIDPQHVIPDTQIAAATVDTDITVAA